MFVTFLLCVCASVAVVCGQFTSGLYRIANNEFFKKVAAQSGSSILTIPGAINNDAGVTWFIAPASGQDAYTIQNAKSLQYMAVNGALVAGSVVAPQDAPFVWTLQTTVGTTLVVNNLAVATFDNGTMSLQQRGPDPSQLWTIGGIQPFPATYRIWNSQTDTYLTAPASVPGSLTATASNPTNALQYWRVAGTAADSVDGTLQNVKTGAYVTVSNGAVGTFSTTAPSQLGWLFSTVGGGDRLSYFLSPSPNVLAINAQGQVILDSQNSGNQQIFVFVPADPASAQ